jgi:hypothetical protein
MEVEAECESQKVRVRGDEPRTRCGHKQAAAAEVKSVSNQTLPNLLSSHLPTHLRSSTNSYHCQLTMPPRAAFIEEFDDDMDIPLPSRPLPSTGTRGQIIEEIDIASDDHGPGTGINRGASSSSGRPGPSGSTAQQPPSRQAFSKMQEQVQVLQGADRSPYKTYVS